MGKEVEEKFAQLGRSQQHLQKLKAEYKTPTCNQQDSDVESNYVPSIVRRSYQKFQHPFDPPNDSDTSEGIDVDAVPTPPSNKFYSSVNPPLKNLRTKEDKTSIQPKKLLPSSQKIKQLKHDMQKDKIKTAAMGPVRRKPSRSNSLEDLADEHRHLENQTKSPLVVLTAAPSEQNLAEDHDEGGITISQVNKVQSNKVQEKISKSKIYFKKVQSPPAADINNQVKTKPPAKNEQIKPKYEDNPVYKSYHERNKVASNKKTNFIQPKNKGVEYSGKVILF